MGSITADRQRTASDHALDQSRDVISVQARLAGKHLRINRRDGEILRRLAHEVGELAARPIEETARL